MLEKRDIFAPLVGKLSKLADIDRDDRDAIQALPFRLITASPRELIIREGQAYQECHLLLEGYVCRYKNVRDGGRQIVSFHMAGDIIDLERMLLEQADHSVLAVTQAALAAIPVEKVRGLARQSVSINNALWRDVLIDASIFREWVLNVGRRDAKARIAHMLCEFEARHAINGLDLTEQRNLPMTQEQIADATGLTTVHVNRTLLVLEQDGLVQRDRRGLIVTDWDGLRRAADFDSAYLHQAA